MENRSKTLYTGITGNLIGRVRRHKLAMASQFTSKYKLDRLVYIERYEDVHKAIEREKEIQRWIRIKKIATDVSVNPAWRDLSVDWLDHHPFEPDAEALHRHARMLQADLHRSSGPQETAPQDDNIR